MNTHKHPHNHTTPRIETNNESCRAAAIAQFSTNHDRGRWRTFISISISYRTTLDVYDDVRHIVALEWSYILAACGLSIVFGYIMLTILSILNI